ncbi:MAG: NgoFVII family restriction endonuclease [Elusimicrobiota bacterium]|nr:NgoFVII family restriction endonuclease [Elusimicrobiota bacterium]
MIELLNSNFSPLITKAQTFPDVFFSLLQHSISVKIASGYISEEAIAELLGLYNSGLKTKLSVVVGMHFFEGFSIGQYEALLELSKLLNKNDSGKVFLSKVSKYHGKVYSFQCTENDYSAIVGSSNLTKISTMERIYDTDILICNETINANIEHFLTDLQNKYCRNIEAINRNEITIVEPNNLFEGYLGVEKVTDDEITKTLNSLTPVSFDIEIKPEEKSHLNCYHGKGRGTPNGLVRHRPWYESNIMVSNNITRLPDYPREIEFTVITDDGYKFKCVTNGDYAKNLRSAGDLQILGRWLKGRLENSNALKIGAKVTADTFIRYGRNTITLTKTSILGTWYMDFGVNK